MPITVGSTTLEQGTLTGYVHESEHAQFSLQNDKFRLMSRDTVLREFPGAWELVDAADQECGLVKAERLLRRMECLTARARHAVLAGTDDFGKAIKAIIKVRVDVRRLLGEYLNRHEETWCSVTHKLLNEHSPTRVLRALVDAERPEDMIDALA